MIAKEEGDSVRRTCRDLEVPRSTACYKPAPPPGAPKKRGPKTALSDEALLAAIRKVLASSDFVGEGHRKIWAMLREKEAIRTGKARVLRLCRLNGLLAPCRAVHERGNAAHDGRIIELVPDRTWGTDMTTFLTGEGVGHFFFTIDHCTAEVLGHLVTDRCDRWAALDPIHQAAKRVKGSVEKDVCRGTRLRHDHGPQYVARDILFRHGCSRFSISRHSVASS